MSVTSPEDPPAPQAAVSPGDAPAGAMAGAFDSGAAEGGVTVMGVATGEAGDAEGAVEGGTACRGP